MKFLKKKPKKELSEGEELIKEYLDEEDIKAIPQKEINGLEGDTYPKRIADFYLPKYKIYVEFLGNWNKPREQEEYREKMGVYKANSIPCIYIWPDNLGTLNFILKRRLKKELQKHKKLKWQLFSWNWQILTEKLSIFSIILLVLIYYVDNLIARILFGVLFLNSVYSALKISFFRKIK